MTKAEQSEREAARETLLKWLKPGDTVHTILRHCSRSGMSRSISLMAKDENGDVAEISYWAAKVMGDKIDRERGGIKIGGCGMDMGFALVYALSAALWPNGHGCTGEGCHSNDHANGDRDYTPHGTIYVLPDPKNGVVQPRPPVEHWHADAGYALRHRSL